MGGEPARACGGARGLDGEAGTGGGEAGELVVVGLRAIRSEKARVCGFDEPSSFFFPWPCGKGKGKQTGPRRWD